MIKDLRFALRAFSRVPGFTLLSIATLALAGVACTFIGTTVLFPLLLLLIERLHVRKPPAR